MFLPYQIVIIPDPIENTYTVTILDLPGCLTSIRTLDKLSFMVEDAKRCWFEAALEDGIAISEPSKFVGKKKMLVS